MKKIYEDKYYQEQPQKNITDLNTEEQLKKGQFYLARYRSLKDEMFKRETEWNELEKLYKSEKEIINDNAPNSFIPLIAPIVDGQIANMTEQTISSNVKGKRMSDQGFARDAQTGIDLILRENDIRQRVKVGIKRYSLFGNFVIKVDYDPTMYGGFGMARIRFVPINKVYVDGNIKELYDYQDSEYIIEEIGHKSIMWARAEYGDDIADFLTMRNADDNGFESDISDDEQFGFTLIEVLHRNNKKRVLQKIEMDETGFILRESSPKEPLYKFTDNQYPYVFGGLYHEEGEFYRFGDGKRLKYMQELLNNLYDEVVTAIKYSSQGKKYIDPAGQCDPEEVADADPSKPVVMKDPRNNIYISQGAGIHPVVLQIINQIVMEAQRVARFSALMTGTQTGEKITATQAGIQTQQGNVNISDKKQDISSALAKAAKYALEICMEKWTSGIDVYEDEKREKATWLDLRSLSNVPVMVPADGSDYQKRFGKMNPDSEKPKWMQYVPDEDILNELDELIAEAKKPMTRKADFDIEISIGEGLPTNKIAIYNIILSLAQLQLIDENTGQPRPLLGYNQVKQMIEDLVGLPIDDALEEAKNTLGKYGVPMPQVKQGPVNVNPNIPGANMGGNMSGASIGGGGMAV